MNLKDPKVRLIGAAAAAALVLILVLIIVLVSRGRKGDGPPPPGPKPEPDPELTGPTIDKVEGFTIERIRRKPDQGLEVAWKFPNAGVPGVKGFELRRWDRESRTWTSVAGSIPASRHSAVDPTPKKVGIEYAYRVRYSTEQGRIGESDEVTMTFADLPVPPAPEDLKARRVRFEGREQVLLQWSSKRPGTVQGYAVYADDTEPGIFVLKTPGPLNDNRFALPFDPERAPAKYRVVSLGAQGQESAPAETTLELSGDRRARPESLKASRENAPGAPVVLEWAYPSDPTLEGFRLYHDTLLLAGPPELGPETRRWEHRILLPGTVYRYSVEAVAKDGTVSSRTAAAPFSVEARPRAPGPPQGGFAEWIKEGKDLRVRISWIKVTPDAGSTYTLELGEGGAAAPSFRVLQKDLAIDQGQVVVTPPDGLRPYVFRLREVNAKGTAGIPVLVELPGLKEFAPPARLKDYTVADDGTGNRRITWTWEYPDLPSVKGFRIHLGGTTKLAGEEVLGPTTRRWTSPPLTQKGILKFSIEAVLVDDTVAPRGPEQVYLNSP